MIRPQHGSRAASAAELRLSRMAALTEADLTALRFAEANGKVVRARRDILGEGQKLNQPMLIVSGWAARVRLVADGRRQFVDFLLPGDLIGCWGQQGPLMVSTVLALTDVIVAPAPSSDASAGFREAYAMSRAVAEAHLIAQVVRLGRLNAQERILDLFLELHDRLRLTGLAEESSFELPLTQEMLADALGLTPVHINRTLQAMRRDNQVTWKQGRFTLRDAAALARQIGRS